MTQQRSAPLIGISGETEIVARYWGTVRHQIVTDDYVKAIRAAGGIPIVLPVGEPDEARAILRRVDGLIITGGSDISPVHYGEERVELGLGGTLDMERDNFDLALATEAVATDVPLLCICRGQQVLNVSRGGSLIQHLETHGETAEGERTSHTLVVDPSSRFAERFPHLGATNSFHHQAVNRPGDGVRIAATAPDGVIESIELVDAPNVVSVQWHPEVLLDHPDHLGLFEWLVNTAAARNA
jgi:putative glutamine amidotransferase